MKYVWNILISIDQLVNTLFGGDPDETISSRVGKWQRAGVHKTGWKRIVFKITNPVCEFFETNHFKKSIEDDEGHDEVLK